MADPLRRWLENEYVVEELCFYLSERDICVLCSVSRSWRQAVNLDKVWSRVVKQKGYHHVRIPDECDDDNDGNDEANGGFSQGLESQCYWARVLSYTSSLRKKWTSGSCDKTVLDIPRCVKSSAISCFDSENQFFAIGTKDGHLVVFDLDSQTSQNVRAVKKTKIEKLYVRHSKIILTQFGLIQVYCIYPRLKLIYCKTLENPDLSLVYGDNYCISPEDPFHVPHLNHDQMSVRYLGSGDLDLSKMDLTVSTAGDERLGLVVAGHTNLQLYRLDSGDWLEKVDFGPDERILKIGIVHIPGYENLLYSVVQDVDFNISGIMYDINKKQRVWKLYLHTVFNYNYSVFSLFTSRGMLMFGRKPADSYPYTWLWKSWTYQGEDIYSYEFETEYDMYLADCLQGAVVTPRAMTYLFPGSSTLVFSHRTHRGVSTLAYSWPGNSKKLWRFSSMSEACTLRSDSNIPVCGSDVAQTLVTGHGTNKMQIRDLRSGKKLVDLEVAGVFSNLWCDDTKLIAINTDLANNNPISVISFK